MERDVVRFVSGQSGVISTGSGPNPPQRDLGVRNTGRHGLRGAPGRRVVTRCARVGGHGRRAIARTRPARAILA